VTARLPVCRAVATTVERPACSNPPPVPPSRCTPSPPSRAQSPRLSASGFQFDPWRRLAREAQRAAAHRAGRVRPSTSAWNGLE
jgi:hypothetical protein